MMIIHIALKELLDALRDKRTMLVLIISVFLGIPFALFFMSEAANRAEKQAENKTILVSGIHFSPTLENYILRQGYQVKTAPTDYEAQLQDKRLINPVLVINADFEQQLAQGARPIATIVLDLANQDTQMGVRPVRALLQGYSIEKASMNLAMRGVSADILTVLDVQERHLSRSADNGAQIKQILTMMLMWTMVSVGLSAAIDTTAGERERGSLEPLLMTPVSSWQFVTGKWLAVGSITMLVTILNVASIFPASWLVRNESLRLLVQFGGVEIAKILLVLLPLGLCLSALQIAFSINGKTYKEAQVRCTILLLAVMLMPLLGMFKQGVTPAWFKWVPLLSQNQLMEKILNNEVVNGIDIAAPLLICLVLTTLALTYTSRKIRRLLM